MDSEGSDFARPEVLGAGLIRLEVAGKARKAAGSYGPDFPSGEIWGFSRDLLGISVT
jgi:hypothetical protein